MRKLVFVLLVIALLATSCGASCVTTCEKQRCILGHCWTANKAHMGSECGCPDGYAEVECICNE